MLCHVSSQNQPSAFYNKHVNLCRFIFLQQVKHRNNREIKEEEKDYYFNFCHKDSSVNSKKRITS